MSSRRPRAAVAVLIAALAAPALARGQVAAQDSTPIHRHAVEWGLVSATAAQPASLTLDSVYALVASRSPRIRAAVALATASEARVAGMSRPPDPRMQLGFMNYSLPALRPDPTLGMTQLQVMQMLPLPTKLGASRNGARARADAADARAQGVAWETRTAAAMAFYDRYELAARIDIALATRRLLDDVVEIAGAMYRVGDGQQADVLRARVEVARMNEDIVRMRAMDDAAAARLAALVDLPVDAVAGSPVIQAFPDGVPALETLETLALASNVMLDAAAADLRAAQADAALARRELWPDLDIGVQYGQRAMDMRTDRMGSLMIGASIPVFARSRQLKMRDEAAAMQAMATAELEGMRADTRGRVRVAHAELLSARRLAALYRTTVLPQAEAATTSALASYRTGAVDFMTVVDNRMNVNRYQQELIALQAAEGRAWAELEMLVGQPLVTTSAATPRTPGRTR